MNRRWSTVLELELSGLMDLDAIAALGTTLTRKKEFGYRSRGLNNRCAVRSSSVTAKGVVKAVQALQTEQKTLKRNRDLEKRVLQALLPGQEADVDAGTRPFRSR
eukprot:6125952-Amphidinium_carterae.1